MHSSTYISSSEAGDANHRAAERLDSWKEIASFFRREVRTVQLWEKNEGLPVRRQYHKKLGSVYAYRHELDTWWKSRSTVCSSLGNSQHTHSPPARVKPVQMLVKPLNGAGPRILALPLEVIPFGACVDAKSHALERFARGLQHDLVLELTRSNLHPVVLPLTTIPSQATSALAWANEIATELEIDAILSGSIRCSGNQLRVSMQMVRASDLLCLWSDRFDAEIDSTFDAQAELARKIGCALPNPQVHCAQVRSQRSSANMGLAFHACSMGFHSWQQRGMNALRKAANYFNDAIELNPQYAEAYAGLADTYISLSYHHLMPAQQAAARAWRAVQTALKLDRDSIKVNNAYINALIHCNWNLEAAERRSRQMIDAGRLDARTIQLYSSIMILRNRHQESIDWALRACELAQEPDQIHLNGQVSLAYFYSGDYVNAISVIRRTVEQQPQNMMGYVLLGRAEAQLGNWDDAICAFTMGLELSQGSLLNKALLASAYAGSGDTSRACSILKKLSADKDKETFPAYNVSAAYAALNQEDEAIKHIRKAFESRDLMSLYVNQDPRFSQLRKSPDFRRISSMIDTGFRAPQFDRRI